MRLCISIVQSIINGRCHRRPHFRPGDILRAGGGQCQSLVRFVIRQTRDTSQFRPFVHETANTISPKWGKMNRAANGSGLRANTPRHRARSGRDRHPSSPRPRHPWLRHEGGLTSHSRVWAGGSSNLSHFAVRYRVLILFIALSSWTCWTRVTFPPLEQIYLSLMHICSND